MVAHEGMSSGVELQAVIWRMRADLERLVAEAGPVRIEVPGLVGEWSLKEVIAHLTAWRWWTVARLEAAVGGTAPVPPWASDLDEEREGDTDRINRQFHEASRNLSVADVLCDSRATLDRLEAAILALPDADLFTPGRYPWLGEYPLALVVTSSAEHLREHDEEAMAALRAGGGGPTG
jgi:acetyl esterase/lipase